LLAPPPSLVGIFLFIVLCALCVYFYCAVVRCWCFTLYLYSFGLLVRMSIFIVHSWLLKSQVDVPVSGSMILVGVLLKLVGYPLTHCICPIRGKLPLPSSSEVYLL